MWFRYNPDNPLNFAYRWQQWELEHPCPAELRRTWPAFSPTGDGTPFTGSKAATYLRVVLALVMTPVEAAKRSWHACRVTIATQLFKRRTGTSGGGGSIPRDEIEGVIQAVVRWKTPEAMRIYARMEAETYADYVDLATQTDAGASIPDDLPEVDPERLMREHEATFDAMEADERAARKAAAAARAPKAEAAAAASGNKRRRSAPATGDTCAAAAPAGAAPRAFDVGEESAVTHAGADSWGVVGQHVSIHHSFWQIDDGGYSTCVIVGYVGRYAFHNGKASPHTYVVEHEGHCYLARHTTIARSLVDPAVARRVQKAGAPRLLRN